MAHEYRADVAWRRNATEEEFSKGRYSREHLWRFDGGIALQASASPSVVPLPYSREDAIDPEEAFVAAVSSCHMLSFLYIAQRAGHIIDSYEDEAVGVMERIEAGKMAITKVTLRPRIRFNSQAPGKGTLDDLHHHAHEACFIANSVKTEISVEART
jgi:organic hydroperoxide reductase OsmC/OhrA